VKIVGMTLDIVLYKHDLTERRLNQCTSSRSPNEAKIFIEDGGSIFSKTLEEIFYATQVIRQKALIWASLVNVEVFLGK
jgi:hypothetical protein